MHSLYVCTPITSFLPAQCRIPLGSTSLIQMPLITSSYGKQTHFWTWNKHVEGQNWQSSDGAQGGAYMQERDLVENPISNKEISLWKICSHIYSSEASSLEPSGSPSNGFGEPVKWVSVLFWREASSLVRPQFSRDSPGDPLFFHTLNNEFSYSSFDIVT